MPRSGFVQQGQAADTKNAVAFFGPLLAALCSKRHMDLPTFIIEFLQAIAWPSVAITALVMFRTEAKALLERLAKLKIGDHSVEFFKTELEKAQELSTDVESDPDVPPEKRELIAAAPKIPITEANAKMLQHGLRPSPSGLELAYYQDLAARDPALALAGLRIELEIIGRNLAHGFKVEIPPNGSISSIFRELSKAGAVTNRQYSLVQSISRLANSAVHGVPVTQADANAVIDTAGVLRDQYLSWLSWGFE